MALLVGYLNYTFRFLLKRSQLCAALAAAHRSNCKLALLAAFCLLSCIFEIGMLPPHMLKNHQLMLDVHYKYNKPRSKQLILQRHFHHRLHLRLSAALSSLCSSETNRMNQVRCAVMFMLWLIFARLRIKFSLSVCCGLYLH